MANYYEQFARMAEQYPARVAVWVQRREGLDSFTFDEMRLLSESAASWLQRHGVSAGDRCAILANNDAHWCAAQLGIFLLGAVAVPLDTAYKPRQVATVLQDSGARILFTSSQYLASAREAVADCRQAIEIFLLHESRDGFDGLKEIHESGPASALPPCPATPSDAAVMLYTSGTTSDPKGVVLVHSNLTTEVEVAAAAISLDERDCILGVLPLFHSLAQVANLLLPLGIGASVVFLETLNTTELLRALSERGITAFCCVPQFFYLIHQRINKQLSESGWLKRTVFRLLLRFSGALRDSAGINLGPWLFRRVHKVIGLRMRYLITGGSRFESSVGRDFYCMGFNILQAYGLTECTGGATLTRPEDGWTTSVGRPLAGVEIKIAHDPETGGRDGEVLLRGPNIMQGYYNRPDANAEAFHEGWFHTGDLGYQDAKGLLHITGRKKEMIVLSSGKNIYPEEVEAHYNQTPCIKELCVLGLAREGEPAADRLHAVIVPDFDYLREHQIVNTREILRFEIENLSIQLPGNKRILSYDIWAEELPRTTTRKLKRFTIEAMLKEKRTAEASKEKEQPAVLSEDDKAWANQPEIRRALEIIRKTVKTGVALVPDANIELDLGLDSMERVELLAHLEKVFSAQVPEEVASGIYTIRELVEAVLASRGEPGENEQKGDTWRALLQTPLEDDPEFQALLKPKPVVTALMFATLKIAYFASRLLFRFRVRGRENLPRNGPLLLCPNHQSYFDAFLLSSALPYSLFRQMFFVGASEYFDTPFTRRLARLANIVPVDPDANLLRAMQAGSFGLQNNKVLILFPEGERCIDGEIKKFKKGAPILSMNLKVPIVPVAFNGLFEVWPRGRSFQKLAPVQMTFGNPLPAQDHVSPHSSRAEAEALYTEVANRLRQTVVELRETM